MGPTAGFTGPTVPTGVTVPTGPLGGHPPPCANRSRAPVWLLAAAAAWSVGLIAAGLLLSPSLVEVNGEKVLVPLALPLLVVVLASALLWFRTRRPVQGAGPLAWGLSVLLDLLALAGMLTIGVFILPVAVLVTVACALQ